MTGATIQGRLEGRTALITGGGSGIGLATARRFVSEGAKVVLTGRRGDVLDAAVSQLGPHSIAAAGDVTDPGALEGAVAAAIRAFGRLDVVFANAGVSGATPIGSTSAEAFRRIIDINLLGPFLTVQAARPHLAQGASIILNGSVHAVFGVPGSAAYAASKAGVRAMTRNFAAELAPQGIRVNAVVPGATETPIWSDRAPTPDALQALEAAFTKGVPLSRRFAAPEQIASAVLYLASDEASYITASEIVVDGGMTGAPGGASVYRR